MEAIETTYRHKTKVLSTSARIRVARYIDYNPLGVGFLLRGKSKKND